MDLSKLNYYTTAAWLRGYASSFADEYTYPASAFIQIKSGYKGTKI